MNISVIVAMFNEEESIPLLLTTLQKLVTLAPAGWGFEFILVNDGSKDKTLNALEGATTKFPIQVISHPTNLGFGAAIRTGIQNAKGDIIICYDADCTYPVEDSIKLVKKITEGYDVASANPFHERKTIEKVPLWRQALTWMNAILYKIVLGKGSDGITIMSCAFRAYRSETLKNTPFRSNGFGAASEILGRMLIKGYLITEVPSALSVRKFGKSKMNVVKAIKEHMGNLALFFRIRFFKF